MVEEETFEDEGLNIKVLMALINNTPDGGANKGGVDTSQAIQEPNIKS